eukprot:1006822-Karenia_brevis.AAC.1
MAPRICNASTLNLVARVHHRSELTIAVCQIGLPVFKKNWFATAVNQIRSPASLESLPRGTDVTHVSQRLAFLLFLKPPEEDLRRLLIRLVFLFVLKASRGADLRHLSVRLAFLLEDLRRLTAEKE